MKHTMAIFTLLASILFMSFMTDKPIKVEKLSCDELDKSVVKISDKVYAGKYEASNRLYMQFLQSLQADGKTELLKTATLDTTNWRDKVAYIEPYVDYYHNHPAYANYPVVNVSYEGANLFCQWLTNFYNDDVKRKFKKVTFRLPTEQEWVTAAKGGDKYGPYPWGIRLQDDKGMYQCNFTRIGSENLRFDTVKKQIIVDYNTQGFPGQLNDAADITAPVDAYWPNKFGIYNISGNAAEMISQKGIACGGGWRSVGGDVRIESRMVYKKSAPDVGFRYFMEIIEE